MPPHHVLIVLFDGVQSLDVTGPLEVFTGAGRLAPGRYRISTGSFGGVPVRTSSGLKLAPDLALTDPPDTLIVPGGAGTRPPPPELVEWLRRQGAKPQRVMSVCSGAYAIGPYEILSRLPGASLVFVAAEAGPIRADTGRLSLVADASLDEVSAPDLVLVPGSPAAPTAPGPVLHWLRAVDGSTTWTTSVCTGSLALAAAGLLTGRRATTHWLALPQLADLGAVPVSSRVVIDGKYATAAGVSAGLDLALDLAARIAGVEVAQAIQLAIEYDPAPPFDAGSPQTAPPAIEAALRSRRHLMLDA